MSSRTHRDETSLRIGSALLLFAAVGLLGAGLVWLATLAGLPGRLTEDLLLVVQVGAVPSAIVYLLRHRSSAGR